MTVKQHLTNSRPFTAVLLAVMAVLSTFGIAAHAQTAESYAVLDGSGTLTFAYGVKPDSAYTMARTAMGGLRVPEWHSKAGKIKKVVFSDSFAQARPTDCSYWFMDAANIKTFEGAQNLNTELVTNMEGMFYKCIWLSELDVSCFNTKNVTNMRRMFYGCHYLTALDLSNFNTQNVTDMSYMFHDCQRISELDLSGFDTRSVTNMESMFDGCYRLLSLDLSGFDTQNVTNMSTMFYKCSKLDVIDVSGFNTQNVTAMDDMFCGCGSVTSLDLRKFDTHNVTDMSSMFSSCSKLASLDVSSFNTQKVIRMAYMFEGCRQLSSLDLCNFNTSNAQYMIGMFKSCSKLAAIYVRDSFTTAALKQSDRMFDQCTALKGAISYDGDKVTSDFANYATGYFTKLVATLGKQKIGAVGEPLTADSLVITSGEDFVAYEPFRVGKASFSRKVESEWSTLCLPFAISQNEEECQFYMLSGVNVTNATAEVDAYPTGAVIQAGTPLVYKMNDGYTSIDIAATDTPIGQVPLENFSGNWALNGTFTSITGERSDSLLVDGCYVLSAGGFWNACVLRGEGKDAKVGAMEAFITAFGAQLPAVLRFTPTSGGTTSVVEPMVADSFPHNAPPTEYYDVQGRRLCGAQRGIVVVRQGGKFYKKVF